MINIFFENGLHHPFTASLMSGILFDVDVFRISVFRYVRSNKVKWSIRKLFKIQVHLQNRHETCVLEYIINTTFTYYKYGITGRVDRLYSI